MKNLDRLSLVLTAGHAGDSPQFEPVLARIVYGKCIDGQDEVARRRIEDVPGGTEST